MYSNAVQLVQKNFTPGRSVMLTLQYRFNTTRDRYRGTGAGNSENPASNQLQFGVPKCY